MTSNRLEDLLLPFRKIGAGVHIVRDGAAPFVFGIQCCGKGANDEHVEMLRQFPDLRAVGLQDCPISNKAMRTLIQLKRLESLDIDGTLIDDDGLAELRVMIWLDYLHVRRTQVSDAGIQQLQTFIPDCEIVSDWTFDFS